MNMLDFRVMIGSHIDRDTNSQQYIKSHKITSDALIQVNMSQVPMKY
jgi:hypothetical protein